MKKSEVRSIFNKKREAISDADVQRLSKEVFTNFLNAVDLSKFSVLHCFLPVKNRNEINTWILIEEIRIRYPKLTIAVPVSDLVNNKMKACILDQTSILKHNKWGIPEPVDCVEVSPGLIEIIIIPLLGFDKSGNRVGYGKGFYDNFLLKCSKDVLKVGVSFFEPVDHIEDAFSGDVPLNLCITPNQIFSF